MPSPKDETRRLKAALVIVWALLAGAALELRPGPFYSKEYYGAVFLLLTASLAVLAVRPLGIGAPGIGPGLGRAARFGLVPFALFPFLTCLFRLPFLFCPACPRRCPWGELRPLLFPAMVSHNLAAPLWCRGYCPFGSLQEALSGLARGRTEGRAHDPSRAGYLLAGLFLALAALTWIRPSEVQAVFFWGVPWAGWGILALVLIWAALSDRPWCRHICPVGAVGRLTGKASRRLMKEENDEA